MKSASFRSLALIFSLVVLFSCKKDNPINCSGLWTLDLLNEATAVSTASTIYSQDPSAANCNALKDAYQDYINAMKPYGDCETLTGTDRAEWKQELDELEADLDSIC